VKQTLVFKVGGALLEDYSAAQTLLSAILEIQQFANLVLVHGGLNTD
jgi:acetylglutamate kinase